MRQNQPRLGVQDIAVGMDLSSEGHVVVALAGDGRRLTRFKVPHSLDGLAEVLRRCAPEQWNRPQGRAVYAFEATGHIWQGVANFLEQAGQAYWIVNPLATFRVREARQMGRDKRDVTDAEQIADLLRTGMVTQTQLLPEIYLELRWLWNEYDRLRTARARLKTLVTHQLYGLFPEFVGNWADVFAPGSLAVLRLGLSPREIASHSVPELITRAKAASRGRRLWRFKVRQVVQKARKTVAAPQGARVLALEIRRVIERVDLLSDQLDQVASEMQELLEQIEEARYLKTLPGIGWVTVAGLLAEIGPIDRYRHGRQLIKLAGINPGRHETGKMAGSTRMTHRGRARLRALVYMATLSSIQHNPRLRAHYERLLQREDRPLRKMSALGACMTKFLLYAFAVMKRREAFKVEHRWKEAHQSAA